MTTEKTAPRSAPELSAKALERAYGKPSEKRWEMRDKKERGLRARVNRDGSVTFLLVYRTAGGRAGEVRRFTLGSYPTMTLDAAQKRAREVRGMVADGADPVEQRRDRATVKMLADDYLAGCDARLKPSSAKEYRRLWAEEIAPTFGHLYVDTITPKQVASWHRQFNSPKEKRQRPYVGNRALAVLAAFFTWCETEAHAIPAHSNPAARVKKFKEQKRTRYLTRDEAERVGSALTAALLCGLPTAPDMAKKGRGMANARKAKLTGRTRGPYDTRPQHFPASMTVEPASPIAVAALRFLMLTGWRVSEVLALKWSEVDTERRYAKLTDTKTGQSNRPLGDAPLRLLSTVPRIDKEPRVFPVASLDRLWLAVRHAAGVPDVRLHDLRHTFASFAVSSGASLPIIGAMLGHKDVKSTARYSHLLDEAVQLVASATSQTLGNFMGLPAPKEDKPDQLTAETDRTAA